jgi:hypothetical protein
MNAKDAKPAKADAKRALEHQRLSPGRLGALAPQPPLGPLAEELWAAKNAESAKKSGSALVRSS